MLYAQQQQKKPIQDLFLNCIDAAAFLKIKLNDYIQYYFFLIFVLYARQITRTKKMGKINP